MFTTAHCEPGGCASHSRLLTGGLADRGWRVLAFGRGAHLRRFRLTRTDRHRQLEIPGMGWRAGAGLYITVACAAGLLSSLRRRPDAVLVFQMGAQVVAGGLCARLLRRPLVVMSTLSGPAGDIALVATSPHRWVHRWLVRHAQRLIGQTQEAADELGLLAPRVPVSVLPNPVAPRSSTPLNGRPNAVFVGRLAPAKDIPLLLRAWGRVLDDVPSAGLTLIGAGDAGDATEAELRSMVAADGRLTARVSFAGWIDDVPAALSRHDVFVLPSRHEGLSNALLEACASGRVVVVSDIRPNMAVVGEGYPLAFRTGDCEHLASTLLAAFDDPEIRLAASEQVAQGMGRFSPPSVLAELERLLIAASPEI